MLMTVLEARVLPDKWATLRSAWADQSSLRRPPQLRESFLTQAVADRELWRIVSIWPDRAALDEMRRLEPVPGGVLIFRAAGAEPSLSVFEVTAHLPTIG